MKIDLDELERKARRWDKAIGKDDEADARLDHIAANSPPVTLALIARIRELEDALRDACAGIGLSEPHTEAEARDDAELSDRCLAILEKGAVLQ